MLTTLDIIVVLAYLLAIATIGTYFYRRRTGLQEYLLGSKAVAWIPVALSILAADMSSLTYLGTPAWVFLHDMKLSQIVLVYPIVVPLVIWIFLPLYSKSNLYTAYQYLERRLGLPARLVSCALFLFIRGAHAAIIIYVPALILFELMQIPLAVSVLIMGLVTAFYTMMGGVKAVIWTDAIQVATVLLGFTVVATTAIHNIPGGLSAIVAVGMENSKFVLFDFSSHLSRVDNFWALLIGGIILNVQAMSTDQAVLQKYFTTRSQRDTAKSLYLYGGAAILIGTLLSLLGAILFVYYLTHPQLRSSLHNPDALVPHYAAAVLHHGLAGLVIASIFAGSMSTVSASLNSLATSTVIDVYKRIVQTNKSDLHYTLACRHATFWWGVAATVGALYVGRLGPLVLGFAKIQSVLGGLLLGIFLLAIIDRKATGHGAISGLVFALFVVIYCSLYKSLSLYLYAAVGCATTIVGGCLFSRIAKRIEAMIVAIA